MRPAGCPRNGGWGLANGVCAANFDEILESHPQNLKRLWMLDFEPQNIYPKFGQLVWPSESGIYEKLRRLSMVSINGERRYRP